MRPIEPLPLDGKWIVEFYSGKKLELDSTVFESFADPSREMPLWIRLFTPDGHILIIPRESIATIEFIPKGASEWPEL